MPSNVYPQDSRVIAILRSIFVPIWDGLTNTNVPGFDFSIAAFFIALLTAGLIGLILKAAFNYFGSHFTDGPIKRGAPASEKPRGRQKG